MKSGLLILTLALVALVAFEPVAGQQLAQSTGARGVRSTQTEPYQRPSTDITYSRGDTWYELLLKQFNPDNVDYGAWMEQRRQAFLNESIRNPYFNYSAFVTLALLLMAAVCAKQWLDHRRALWMTAEMMADLYNHDLYSRDAAEKAIRKYNEHIERCNRAIEGGEHGGAPEEFEYNSWKVKLEQVTEERDRYLRERDAAQRELETNRRTLADLSLRLDNLSAKPAAKGKNNSSVELSSADPAVVRHINNLQEQIYAERETNKRLKGA